MKTNSQSGIGESETIQYDLIIILNKNNGCHYSKVYDLVM